MEMSIISSSFESFLVSVAVKLASTIVAGGFSEIPFPLGVDGDEVESIKAVGAVSSEVAEAANGTVVLSDTFALTLPSVTLESEELVAVDFSVG